MKARTKVKSERKMKTAVRTRARTRPNPGLLVRGKLTPTMKRMTRDSVGRDRRSKGSTEVIKVTEETEADGRGGRALK